MRHRPRLRPSVLAAVVALGTIACAADADRACEAETPLPARPELRCAAEFEGQAARPLDASLPGALTVKTIVDQAEADAVYFLDTNAYPMHKAFAVEHLGYPPDGPFVNEYFTPDRRFLLGSATYYEEPEIWAYELAPYDTASAELIAKAFRALAGAAYFGGALRFHPTSEDQAERALALPGSVPVVTTEEIYAGISYQPLNLGETVAQVRVLTVGDLAATYVGPRELAVLDSAPNDISTVAGIVTEAFQTPLSHVNVLSQQRGTPNMALRDAASIFGPYDGQWVRLVVGAFEYSLSPATVEEADAWFEAHQPPIVTVPPLDLTVTELTDVDDVGCGDVGFAGGKASNYGELREIGGPVTVRDGFVVPMSEYRRFLEDNGFVEEITAMLEDPDFQADGDVRRARLLALQAEMAAAPASADLLDRIDARLDDEFPGVKMRFRSSTNAEDLAGYTGAGLYTSVSAVPGDPERTVEAALRAVWASTWNLRAFEERAYAQIPHLDVGMAVLVHPTFDGELANGVAITANVFDPAPGGEDAFYVNAQLGEVSVVQPDPGIVADQLVYYYFHGGQPATYYAHSSLVLDGETVLDGAQLFELGGALDAIREHFAAFYDPPAGYGALPMDVEWKLVADDGGGGDHIEIKQARLYPGRGE
jgi:pyruvate, water dikinase